MWSVPLTFSVWSVAPDLCGIVRIVHSSVRFAVIFALAALIAACGSAQSTTNIPTAPTSTAEYSQADVVQGTGASAATGNIVTVNYTGWLYDVLKPDKKGLQFETSLGTSPIIFQLGAGQVIRGWDQGIVGMPVSAAIPSARLPDRWRSPHRSSR